MGLGVQDVGFRTQISECRFKALDSDFRASGFRTSCRPMLNKPPPLNRDHTRDLNMEALKRKGLLITGLQP